MLYQPEKDPETEYSEKLWMRSTISLIISSSYVLNLKYKYIDPKEEGRAERSCITWHDITIGKLPPLPTTLLPPPQLTTTDGQALILFGARAGAF